MERNSFYTWTSNAFSYMSANELFTYPTYPNPTFQTTAMLSILHMYHMNFILALYKFIACFPS